MLPEVAVWILRFLQKVAADVSEFAVYGLLVFKDHSRFLWGIGITSIEFELRAY